MNQSRRSFLTQVGGTLAFSLVYRGLSAETLHLLDDASSDDLFRNRTFSDLHAHVRLNEWIAKAGLMQSMPGGAEFISKQMNKTKVDLKKCHEAGLDLICVAHFNPFDEFVSMPSDPNPDAPRQTVRMLDELEEYVKNEASAFACVVKSRGELQERLAIRSPDTRRRVALIHCLEGAHALGFDIAPLRILADRGVAMIGVTHFFTKGLASSGNSIPFFPDAGAPQANIGLMERGIEVVKEMQKLGILIDIAHATAPTVEDILSISTGPLVASHVSAQALGDHPYSLTDEHIQRINERGGIVGVILMPYWLSNYTSAAKADEHGSLREVTRTVRYIYKLCGTHKCIGIGSDFAGYVTGPNDLRELDKIVSLTKALRQEFRGEKNSEEIVSDIMAGNVIRLFTEHWGNA